LPSKTIKQSTMKYNIKVTKNPNSRLASLDFNNIPFGSTFSDHMFVADYIDGAWTNLEVKPFGSMVFSPANLALHYGQSIFEGMKATKGTDGNPYLFRPEMHAKRLNTSAARVCMPSLPEDLFLEALHILIGVDSAWIPPIEGSALYIRPFMFATDEMFRVKVSDTYKFVLFTGPVGPYYAKPVKLYAEDHYVRAAVGGVGEAKVAGNYAASLLPARLANEKGYDQIMWLDAKEFKYIQEVGTMNIFFVIDGKVITPATDGAILKGITRDTIMTILRDKGYEVEERPLSIDEVFAASENGTLQEVFGTGTAAVVSNISHIHHKGKEIVLPPVSTHKIAKFAYAEINAIRSTSVEDTRGWMVPVKELVFA
jgi:branched-chain amino acid aminotransferase